MAVTAVTVAMAAGAMAAPRGGSVGTKAACAAQAAGSLVGRAAAAIWGALRAI